MPKPRRSATRSRFAPGAAALTGAARAVASVALAGRSAEESLGEADDSPDRAAIRAIALGTFRWYLRLAPAIEALLPRPEGLPPEIRALLIAAAHQVEYSRNAPQETVHAAVDAARMLGHERTTGLVNAVLRRFVTERAQIFTRLDEDIATQTAHPRWLVTMLAEAWPEHVEQILIANNQHPPMTLRVDCTRGTAAEYVAELADAGIVARPLGWAPDAVLLEKPVSVGALPGFAEGRVSVQDAGAQIAAAVLDAREGMRVLDACAAPGGKTSHILERTPRLKELVAVDVDADRVERISANLRRGGRAATLVAADVRRPESFWDGDAFDRILVDAPCSSTGVIRRHPDIKLLRRASDVAAMAEVQLEILSACFGMLAVGGRLIYATCSVLPQENEQVVERLLACQPRARAVPLPEGLAPGAVRRGPGVHLVPGAQAGTDGFYYACLEKTTVGT